MLENYIKQRGVALSVCLLALSSMIGEVGAAAPSARPGASRTAGRLGFSTFRLGMSFNDALAAGAVEADAKNEIGSGRIPERVAFASLPGQPRSSDPSVAINQGFIGLASAQGRIFRIEVKYSIGPHDLVGGVSFSKMAHKAALRYGKPTLTQATETKFTGIFGAASRALLSWGNVAAEDGTDIAVWRRSNDTAILGNDSDKNRYHLWLVDMNAVEQLENQAKSSKEKHENKNLQDVPFE